MCLDISWDYHGAPLSKYEFRICAGDWKEDKAYGWGRQFWEQHKAPEKLVLLMP